MELKRLGDGMTQINGEMNFAFKSDDNGDIYIRIGMNQRMEFGDAIDAARKALSKEVREMQDDIARTLQLLRGNPEAQEAVRKAMGERLEHKRSQLVYLGEFAAIGI